MYFRVSDNHRVDRTVLLRALRLGVIMGNLLSSREVQQGTSVIKEITSLEAKRHGHWTNEVNITLMTSLNYDIVAMMGVFSIWKAFGGNTHDLGSFEEEMDKTTDLHQHLLRISTQWLEKASQITRDAITTHTETTSQDLKTVSDCTTQPVI
nr:hypothetical protein [Tanacetum cinerariifolium]